MAVRDRVMRVWVNAHTEAKTQTEGQRHTHRATKGVN